MSKREELEKLKSNYERNIKKLEQNRDKALTAIKLRERGATLPSLKKAIARDKAAANENFEKLKSEYRKSYVAAKSIIEGK